MAALNIFTPSGGYAQVSAQFSPQAMLLPKKSSETTMIITNIGGGSAEFTLAAPAKSTTADGTAGSNTITVADAASVAVGQVAVADGLPSGALVQGINGTTITLSEKLTAALSTTSIDFVPAFARGAGMAVVPNQQQVPIGIGSNTYLVYRSAGNYVQAQLNIALGS